MTKLDEILHEHEWLCTHFESTIMIRLANVLKFHFYYNNNNNSSTDCSNSVKNQTWTHSVFTYTFVQRKVQKSTFYQKNNNSVDGDGTLKPARK